MKRFLLALLCAPLLLPLTSCGRTSIKDLDRFGIRYIAEPKA